MGPGKVGNCTGKTGSAFVSLGNAAHPHLEPCEVLDWAACCHSAAQKRALSWGSGEYKSECAPRRLADLVGLKKGSWDIAGGLLGFWKPLLALLP